MGEVSIIARHVTGLPVGSGAEFSLLFAAGKRPSAGQVASLLAASSGEVKRACVSHRPAEGEGWLELLSAGLTFDLANLSPVAPGRLPPARQRFGLAEAPGETMEAVTLIPGPHLAAAGAMLPVVRIMTKLAADLATRLGASAVCWHPAGTWMEPGYFARVAETWLGRGVFPALGLTALERVPDGGVESSGLAFFTGQELRVVPRAGEAVADTVKLAVRAVDHLVRTGPLLEPSDLTGPAGEPLLAEPSADGSLVVLRRDR